MKKLQTTLALLALALLVSAAVLSTPTVATHPEASTNDTYQVHSLTQGAVPAQTQAWEPLLPSINALAMSMIERDTSFDLENPQFIWSALFYMVGIYGETDWRYQDLGDTVTVPEEYMADIAFALFGQALDLPAIPDSLADFIRYENNAYYLAKGDVGLMDTVLDPTEALGDQRHQVTGHFVGLDQGDILCSFQGVLEENDSMYGYCILELWVTMP